MLSAVMTAVLLSASGSVLAVLFMGLRPLIRRRVPTAFLYYIWILILLRMIVPLPFEGSLTGKIMDRIDWETVLTTPTAAEKSPAAATAEGSAVFESATADLRGSETLTKPVTARFAVDLPTAICAVWVAGAVIVLGQKMIAYTLFSRKIRSGAQWPDAADREVFAALHGTKGVGLMRSSYIDSPMLIGVFRPCVVLPMTKYVATGREEQLRFILRHELTHLRRGDLLLKWLVIVISAIHWPNPLLPLIRREVNRACELSCDRAVLRGLDTGERLRYGEALLSAISDKKLPAYRFAAGMASAKREMRERIEGIARFRRPNLGGAVLAGLICIFLAAVGLFLGPAGVPGTRADQGNNSVGALSAVQISGRKSAIPISGTIAAKTDSTPVINDVAASVGGVSYDPSVYAYPESTSSIVYITIFPQRNTEESYLSGGGTSAEITDLS